MHPLLKQILSEDTTIRQNALQQLPTLNHTHGYEAFLSELLAFISKPLNPSTQLLAVQALVWLNDEGLIESLLELARNSALRPVAIRALGRYGDDPDALRRIVTALRDPAPRVRESAVLALGDMHSLNAVEPLLLFIENHSRHEDELNLVAMAVRILGEIGDARAIEPLERLLVEADYETRAAIEWALGNFSNSNTL